MEYISGGWPSYSNKQTCRYWIIIIRFVLSTAKGGGKIAIIYTVSDTELEAKTGWNDIRPWSEVDFSDFDARYVLCIFGEREN